MTCWREEAGEENIASYGTLPQTYITQIGEHMLAFKRWSPLRPSQMLAGQLTGHGWFAMSQSDRG
jgi:hypothetical protein